MWFAVALSVFYPVKYTSAVKSACGEYGVDRSLVQAVILAESGYDKKARSRAGAQGLMQLMPSTAEWVANTLNKPQLALNLFDPDCNVALGTAYLSYLIEKFGLPDAIAAYNAGEGNLIKWRSRGLTEYPFAETRAYVKRVLNAQKTYRIFGRL